MAYLNFLLRPWVGTGSSDTPEGAIVRAGGKHATKTITLNANNTSASVNVFQVTGSTKVTLLHGEILTKTTLTNCTSVYFDLWDGTNSVPITKTTGASMSGYNVGAFFIKDSDVATALSILNNASCGIKEAATGNRVNTEFIAVQKTATNTYIRFNYTTTDAPINATVKVDCQWADIDSGVLTAV
jgi:hypothetical protein